MPTVPTQIRIDRDVKEQASALFNQLGIDMSSAVNLFLHQCLLHDGLPFSVELPRFSQNTLDAIAEAKRISHDPAVPSYDNMEALKKALDE
mgnify:CR=1 FL=1